MLKFLPQKLSLSSQKYGFGIRNPGSWSEHCTVLNLQWVLLFNRVSQMTTKMDQFLTKFWLGSGGNLNVRSGSGINQSGSTTYRYYGLHEEFQQGGVLEPGVPCGAVWALSQAEDHSDNCNLHTKKSTAVFILILNIWILWLKGTVSWDRFQKFWQKFTQIGLTEGCGWFLKFLGASDI